MLIHTYICHLIRLWHMIYLTFREEREFRLTKRILHGGHLKLDTSENIWVAGNALHFFSFHLLLQTYIHWSSRRTPSALLPSSFHNLFSSFRNLFNEEISKKRYAKRQRCPNSAVFMYTARKDVLVSGPAGIRLCISKEILHKCIELTQWIFHF